MHESLRSDPSTKQPPPPPKNNKIRPEVMQSRCDHLCFCVTCTLYYQNPQQSFIPRGEWSSRIAKAFQLAVWAALVLELHCQSVTILIGTSGY